MLATRNVLSDCSNAFNFGLSAQHGAVFLYSSIFLKHITSSIRTSVANPSCGGELVTEGDGKVDLMHGDAGE